MLSHFSCVWLFATLWTIACQAPLSMGFSRQEYWSALPCPPPGDLPNPGLKPASLMHWQVGSLPLAPPGKPQKESVLTFKPFLPLSFVVVVGGFCLSCCGAWGILVLRPEIEPKSPCIDALEAWHSHALIIGPASEVSLWCSFVPQQFIPRRRQWHPTPVLLPGKSHGRRSLVGCSPWGH